MASDHSVTALRDLHRLFSEGTLTGFSDAQLLERFVGRRDAEAFGALVRRHAPMILATCEKILDDPSEIDDAFQAVLLVLVRRSASLWVRDSLCGWLHGVACRVALQANADAARRRVHERRAEMMTTARPATDAHEPATGAHELDSRLHQEVDRLPEKLRTPVLLCYFEGLSYGQAAALLRLSEGTIRGRLARARERLRTRLTRRSIAPVSGLVSTIPTRPAAMAERIHLATELALDTAGRGLSAGSAALLAGRVLRGMVLTRLKPLAAILLVVATMGGFVAHRAAGVQDADAQAPDTSANRPRESPEDSQDGARKLREPVAPRDLHATAGRGSVLVYKLDPSGKRIADGEVRGLTHFQEEYQDRRWIVICGTLDHREIREKLAKASGIDISQAHPQYRRVDLERQVREPGGAWSGWKSVDRSRTTRVLDNLPEEAEDFTPEEVRLGPLVDPLPYLRGGFYRGTTPAHLVPKQQPIDRRQPRGRRFPYPTSEASEVLVRSLDYSVDPGKTYRYRARIVTWDDEPSGRPRERAGPWSEPTVEVSVPAD